MKIIALLAVLACVYFYFARQTPIAEVPQAATSQEAAALATTPKDAQPPRTNALKRPLDRTHEVLGQVAKRNGAGEF